MAEQRGVAAAGGGGASGHFAGRRAVAVGGGVREWNLASSVAPGLRGAAGGVGWWWHAMLALSTSAGAFAMGQANGTSEEAKLDC